MTRILKEPQQLSHKRHTRELYVWSFCHHKTKLAVMENNPVLPVGLVTRSCWLAQQTEKSLIEKTKKKTPKKKKKTKAKQNIYKSGKRKKKDKNSTCK